MKTFNQLDKSQQDHLIFLASNTVVNALAAGLPMFYENAKLQGEVHIALSQAKTHEEKLEIIRNQFAKFVYQMAKHMVEIQVYSDDGVMVLIQDATPEGSA